jgi:hypothetical protein
MVVVEEPHPSEHVRRVLGEPHVDASSGVLPVLYKARYPTGTDRFTFEGLRHLLALCEVQPHVGAHLAQLPDPTGTGMDPHYTDWMFRFLSRRVAETNNAYATLTIKELNPVCNAFSRFEIVHYGEATPKPTPPPTREEYENLHKVNVYIMTYVEDDPANERGPKLVWEVRNCQPGPIDMFVVWEQEGRDGQTYNFEVPLEEQHAVIPSNGRCFMLEVYKQDLLKDFDYFNCVWRYRFAPLTFRTNPPRGAEPTILPERIVNNTTRVPSPDPPNPIAASPVVGSGAPAGADPPQLVPAGGVDKACPACTFLNPAAQINCQICGSRLPP